MTSTPAARTPSQVYTWEPSNEAIARRYGLRPEMILRFDTNTSPAEPAWVADALAALADHVARGRLKRLALERVDGEPVIGSPFGALLIELGFRQSPRNLTLTA